jgi:hypothetical protein
LIEFCFYFGGNLSTKYNLNGQLKMDETGRGRRGIMYSVLVGKPERMRAPGRSRRRLENNIKMDLREMGWAGMDWIDQFQDKDQCRA